MFYALCNMHKMKYLKQSDYCGAGFWIAKGSHAKGLPQNDTQSLSLFLEVWHSTKSLLPSVRS